MMFRLAACKRCNGTMRLWETPGEHICVNCGYVAYEGTPEPPEPDNAGHHKWWVDNPRLWKAHLLSEENRVEARRLRALGLGYADIAASMGLSESTVKNYMRRAR